MERQSQVKPRIILHIGRNKAGSTTIQNACLGARPALLAQGVNYVLFGHLSDSQAGTPGFATFEALRDQAFADPQTTLLVSNEFMFGWPDDFTETAARVLVDCDVQVLAYVRRYDAWIVSAYAEETRKGMNMRDIDEYVDWMGPRISAWRYLEKWAECFGWEAVRVRDIDPRCLWSGDLIADLAYTLGLSPLTLKATPSNISPHWLELELARRLTERNGETEWAGVSHSVLEPLLTCLRPLTHGVGSAVYLRAEDRRRLLDLYSADLTRIEKAGGRALPRPLDQAEAERSAAPSFADARPDLLTAFFQRATGASFALAHPEAAERAKRLARDMAYAGTGGRDDGAGGRGRTDTPCGTGF